VEMFLWVSEDWPICSARVGRCFFLGFVYLLSGVRFVSFVSGANGFVNHFYV